MKCSKCEHIWQKSNMSFSAACPKCQSDSQPENISEALWKVFITAGPMYLQDGQKLLAVFADLAPELKKERNLLELFVGLKGPEKLIQAANAGDAENVIRIVVRDLRDNYGMYEGTAEQLCRAYLAALTGNVIDLTSRPVDRQKDQPKHKSEEPKKAKIKHAEPVEYEQDPLPGEQPSVSDPKINGWLFGLGSALGLGGASLFWGGILVTMIIMIQYEGRLAYPTIFYRFLVVAACVAVVKICYRKVPENQRSTWASVALLAAGACAHENLRFIFLVTGPFSAGWGIIALLLVPLIVYLLNVFFVHQLKADASSKDIWIGTLALVGTTFSVCWLNFALFFCRGDDTVLGWTAVGYVGIALGLFMLSRLQGTFRLHCDRLASGTYLAYFAAALYWLLIDYSQFGQFSNMIMLLLVSPTLFLFLWKSNLLKNLFKKS